MKIVSWNVNGIRAIAKKTFFSDLEFLDTFSLVNVYVPNSGSELKRLGYNSKGCFSANI